MYGSPFPKPTRQIWKAFLKKAAHHLSNDVRLHWNIPNIGWATIIESRLFTLFRVVGKLFNFFKNFLILVFFRPFG